MTKFSFIITKSKYIIAKFISFLQNGISLSQNRPTNSIVRIVIVAAAGNVGCELDFKAKLHGDILPNIDTDINLFR